MGWGGSIRSRAWEEATPASRCLFPEERERGALWVEVPDFRHNLSTEGDGGISLLNLPDPQDAAAAALLLLGRALL